MSISKRAARYTHWSKPVPAQRVDPVAARAKELAKLDRKKEAARLRKLRKAWAPILQLVADSGKPLKSFTVTEIPDDLKAEVLRAGLDNWLKIYNRPSRKVKRSTAKKD